MTKQYFLITGSAANSLQQKVNDKIFDGYELIGGVAIDPAGSFYQAMTKVFYEATEVTSIKKEDEGANEDDIPIEMD